MYVNGAENYRGASLYQLPATAWIAFRTRTFKHHETKKYDARYDANGPTELPITELNEESVGKVSEMKKGLTGKIG